jgi:hypothetical protein
VQTYMKDVDAQTYIERRGCADVYERRAPFHEIYI